jgi:hypothetical protein
MQTQARSTNPVPEPFCIAGKLCSKAGFTSFKKIGGEGLQRIYFIFRQCERTTAEARRVANSIVGVFGAGGGTRTRTTF